jgi:hypothetical protein
MRVELDTCAGFNLIRLNQLPYGSVIRAVEGPNRVQAAQGQQVTIIGEVKLTLRLSDSTETIDAEFLVVKALVVPALLGTPWINRYVWRIDPPKRLVWIQVDGEKQPFRSTLSSSPRRRQHPVRFEADKTLPPFSETWVSCNSPATGLSLTRPSRRRDQMIQAKNGVKSLPPHCEPFVCMVANFSSKPHTLVQGQVNGEADYVSLWPKGKLEKDIRKEIVGEKEWETTIRQSVPHLTAEQKDRLIQALT